MKKTFLTLSLFLVSLITFSQISNGYVKYDIDVEGDDPMVASMMEGATMEMFFGNNNSKVVMSMGMMGKTIVTYNEKKKSGLMLMDMMGMKYALKMSAEYLKKTEEEEKNKNDNTKVTLTNETKKVLGYTCKKAIMTNEDGNESIFWYTEKFSVNKTAQQNLNAKIPGLPLIMISKTDGMTMIFTATKVSTDKVDEKEFDLTIPDGYEEQDIEEFGKM